MTRDRSGDDDDNDDDSRKRNKKEAEKMDLQIGEYDGLGCKTKQRNS